MMTAIVRLLVVDDYEPVRRFVCSMLERRPELQVIGEASDGLEAVQKAEALQPDLILLDIGLPKLNGIEAARQIRKLSPKSRILFLSQETSAHVAQEAFSSGALGYVVKEHAGGELLAAVEAVSQDRKFVSRVLQGHRFNEAAYAGTPDLQRKEDLPSLTASKGEITRTHEAQFYSDDASFLVGFAGFIESALTSGNAVIVVATESHHKSIFERLHAHGVDTAAAIEQGRYIPWDVAEMLATVMAHDLPDPVRFMKVTGELLAAAARAAQGEHPRVAACGEAAPILWAQGKADAAIQLEHLWNEIAKTCNVDILCGYVLETFKREQQSDIYENICAEHSAVYSQ